jgi:hypothetical protein
MKRFLTILTAAACAAVLNSGVLAADKAEKKQLEADYSAAKADCKKMSGADKKACMKKAKADHEAAEERLEHKK